MQITLRILNFCPVPMVILDNEDKTVFINKSFTRLLGYDINDIPDVNHWFACAYPNDKEYRDKQQRVWELAKTQGIRDINFDQSGRPAKITCRDNSLRVFEIYGANIGENYNLVVFVDMTEKEKLLEEKSLLINELRETLAEVETLRGILPICSYCKKVRDDQGYWEQVDVYIAKHSPAQISHGLCPDCLEEHYPQTYRRLQEKKAGDAS